MKERIRREISGCFVPREYFFKGTTKKEMEKRLTIRKMRRAIKCMQN